MNRRRVALLVTTVAGAAGLILAYFDATFVLPNAIVGADFGGYLAAGHRFLDTGSPYAAVQLAGPYNPWTLPNAGVYLYPPPSMLLVVPFLALPAVLWWVIPVGIVAWFVVRCRPAPWAVAVMFACLAWPRTAGAFALGNADLWVTAGIAAGFRWGWPAALILLKPTFAPFALVGIRSRSWWIVAGIVAALSLLMAPLWFAYVTALGNGTGLGLLYSLPNAPMLLVPLVAYAGRLRDLDDAREVDLVTRGEGHRGRLPAPIPRAGS